MTFFLVAIRTSRIRTSIIDCLMHIPITLKRFRTNYFKTNWIRTINLNISEEVNDEEVPRKELYHHHHDEILIKKIRFN